MFDRRIQEIEAVASFTDAWIETQAGLATCFGNRSHLLQMRGLKQTNITPSGGQQQSHLLQMRGLKLIRCAISRVASSRIFYRCVD